MSLLRGSFGWFLREVPLGGSVGWFRAGVALGGSVDGPVAWFGRVVPVGSSVPRFRGVALGGSVLRLRWVVFFVSSFLMLCVCLRFSLSYFFILSCASDPSSPPRPTFLNI